MKSIFYLSFFSMLVLTSCNNYGDELPIHDLEKDISINQLSDSSFFSDIRSITFYKNKFFVTDYTRDNIFILNTNLELEKTLGNKGIGPGELLGASHLVVYQDSIFVLNDEKRTIEVFSFDKHLNTFKIHQELYLNSDARFCIHNENIFLSSFNSMASIAALSFNSDSIYWFGNLTKFRTEKETRIKNSRHLHVMGDRIISIPDCQPKIEVYNMMGDFIIDYELGNINLVNRLIEFTENQRKEIDSYYHLFSDSYVFGNHIFILTLSIDENDKSQRNKLIQFELANDSILPKRILHLGDGWFGPICVTGDKILAYDNSTAELILYNYQ